MRITHNQARLLRELAFSLVPNLCAYIAGGFAADYSLAKDIDLWILNDPLLNVTTQVLNETKVNWTPGTGPGTTDSVPAEDITRTVARIDTPLLPIHVIGTEECTIQELLATFDISTPRWAYTRTGAHVRGDGATTPYENGRVLTYKYKTSTDARVVRLEERYGITIATYQPPIKIAPAA